jgi:hypothetical protein
MTMPSYSVDPETPIVSMLDDMSALSNILSSGRSHNSENILPLLANVVFRSHDPALNKILQTSIPGTTDAESLIKNQNQTWCPNIIENLVDYMVQRIFPTDTYEFSSDEDHYKTMFRNNINLGSDVSTDETLITHDLQLRSIIKSYDYEASNGILYIWIRHTLFFPTDTFDGSNWNVVIPVDMVTPERMARDTHARQNFPSFPTRPAPSAPSVETVLTPPGFSTTTTPMESFQSPISADTSFLPDPFATQFTPPTYLGHPLPIPPSIPTPAPAVPDVHPPAPPNPGLHPPAPPPNPGFHRPAPPAPPPNPGLPPAPLPVPPSVPPVQPQVSTLLQAPTIARINSCKGNKHFRRFSRTLLL